MVLFSSDVNEAQPYKMPASVSPCREIEKPMIVKRFALFRDDADSSFLFETKKMYEGKDVSLLNRDIKL